VGKCCTQPVVKQALQSNDNYCIVGQAPGTEQTAFFTATALEFWNLF